MTTRNVRLSDDDIDRLINWFGYKAGECMDVDEDHWLRDRLVEAKLSPSMDWPAWPQEPPDRPDSNMLRFRNIENSREQFPNTVGPYPSTEEPGER